MNDNFSHDDQMEQARKRVQAKLGFLKHFLIYIVVIAFLAAVNNLTYGGYQWWPWPALGWGIGVVANFLSAWVFVGGGRLEETLMRQEMDRMDRTDRR
jgi:hypothetical protein